MTVKLHATGEVTTVDNCYGMRLLEQGLAVETVPTKAKAVKREEKSEADEPKEKKTKGDA